MNSSLCLCRTSRLNFVLPDLPSRNPRRNAIATSRLAPLSRMMSLHVYCSIARSLPSCAEAGLKASPTEIAVTKTVAVRPTFISIPSIAAAPAQKSDASRAATLKGDGPQRCRVVILHGREEIAAPKARVRARIPCFIQSGVGLRRAVVPSIGGLPGWAITGDKSATMMIVTKAVRDTLIPPTANDPRAAEAHSQSNQLSSKAADGGSR